MTTPLAATLAAYLPWPLSADPDVACLAALVSTAPFVPYPLLRDVRGAAMPSAGFALEARLCESPLVESVAADGFVLHTEARAALRGALREAVVDDGVDIGGTRLREAMHDGLELLSPLLRIEERVVWSYVTQPDYLGTCERELGAVVRAVVRERRLRMLEWASGAMTRLPRELLDTPSVWLLAQMCRAQRLPHPQLGWPEGPVDEGLLLDIVRFVPQTVVGLCREEGKLTLGPVSARRPIGIRIPATQPVTVKVQWPGNPDGVRVEGIDRGTRTLHTGGDPVTIVSLDGRAVRLAAVPAADIAPEIRERGRVFDRLDDARLRRRVFAAQPVRLDVGPHGYLVRLLEEPSVVAYMPLKDAGMPWLTEDQISRVPDGVQRVHVTRVDRERQRVSVRRVKGIAGNGVLRTDEPYRARLIARTRNGLLFDLTEAAALTIPKFERALGLLRTEDLPDTVGWKPKLRSAFSYPIEDGTELDVVITRIRPGNRITVRLADDRDVPGGRLPAGLAVGDRLLGTVMEKLYSGVRFSLDEASVIPVTDRDGRPALPAGLTGFVLNTELSWEGRWFFGGGDAREFPLEPGDRCELLVLGVHSLTGEISLSLKQLVEDPGAVTLRSLRPGSEVDGVLQRRRNHRWRVRLEPWSAIATMSGAGLEHLRNGTRVRVRVRRAEPAAQMLIVELVKTYQDPQQSSSNET
ncbi:hypothetical protein [Streptomyces sp. NPDC006012]|uniref:hypothetical protein n=1 Tax=Streptomyces sp. NPDC006012 TaxID=3364739 RepID=UPI0036C3F27E